LLGRNTFCEGFPLRLVVFLIIIYTFAAHYEANTTDDTDVDGPSGIHTTGWRTDAVVGQLA